MKGCRTRRIFFRSCGPFCRWYMSADRRRRDVLAPAEHVSLVSPLLGGNHGSRARKRSCAAATLDPLRFLAPPRPAGPSTNWKSLTRFLFDRSTSFADPMRVRDPGLHSGVSCRAVCLHGGSWLMGARNSRRRPGGGMGGGGGGGGGGRRGGRRRGRNRGRSRPGRGSDLGRRRPGARAASRRPAPTPRPEDWADRAAPVRRRTARRGADGAAAAAPALQPQHPPMARRRSRRFGAGVARRRRSAPQPSPAAAGAAASASAAPMEMMKQAGLLELMQDGFGFLRFAQNNYLPDQDDIYVPANLVRRYRIRPGSMVLGEILPARKPGQKPALGVDHLDQRPRSGAARAGVAVQGPDAAATRTSASCSRRSRTTTSRCGSSICSRRSGAGSAR